MTNEDRDIQRKFSVHHHAEKIGNARKACRFFFGIDKSSFYRWRDAHQKRGEAITDQIIARVNSISIFAGD